MNDFKYIGYDQNNMARVFGDTLQECELQKRIYIGRKSQLSLYKNNPDLLPSINIKKQF